MFIYYKIINEYFYNKLYEKRIKIFINLFFNENYIINNYRAKIIINNKIKNIFKTKIIRNKSINTFIVF